MTDAALLLDPPAPDPAVAPVDGDGPPPPAVALLVDDSAAAVAATAWAARLARERRSSLLVVVLVGGGDAAEGDAAALLARAAPALDRSGRPYTVRVCTRARRRTARRVLALLPPDVGLLVCPGGGPAPEQGLPVELAGRPGLDLLVVPDLSSVADAASASAPDPAGATGAEPTDRPDGVGPERAAR